MNVRIARDGVEIGECDWEDLEQLVNEGQVLLTDHYWYQGMPDWRLLDDLTALEESEPKPAAPPRVIEPDSTPPPRSPSALAALALPTGAHSLEPWEESSPRPPLFRNRRNAVITCLAVVVAGFFLYLLIGFWTGRPEIPAPIGMPTANLERTDTALREKATTELALRLDKLPKVAAPPSFTFYDSLSISVPDPPAALSVLIRGTETTVNPDTHETISRTDFAVTADYQQGKWLFKSYHALANDLVLGTASEIERDDQHPIPPAIASLLGLDVKSN